jgi:UDP-N-acetylmuramoyl-tripeptide--D-alanyl-D-alanine ligase
MMMLSEIANALNTQLIGKDVNVLSIGTDSRHIVKGQLFVALKGEHFDGNKFASEAIAQGAAAVLISDASIDANPSLLVENTRDALGRIANYWRNKFSLPVVAVTGSNGKTTVKEMIAAIFNSAKGSVLATKGNLNNDIGMPLTLLNLRPEHAYAVIEMGMNHLGEIRYLTNIACPQVALINNAGIAHIGELGSREAIAQAKGEIFEGLTEDGIAVINANDRFAEYWKSLNKNRKIITFGVDVEADVSAKYETQANQINIALKTPKGLMQLSLGLLGKHNVSNALAASAVAVALGIPNQTIANGLSQFQAVRGRLDLHNGYQDAVVIDDTYNANPDSMKVAIDVLASQRDSNKNTLVFVMGDMAELGDEAESMHADIGAYAKEKGISSLLSFGRLSQLASTAFGSNGRHFDSLESLLDGIKAQMHVESCVLVKGSRFMKMERVVNAIIKDQKLGSAH